MALVRPDKYAGGYSHCDAMLGDINGDAVLDGADIDAFFDCLGNGNCP